MNKKLIIVVGIVVVLAIVAVANYRRRTTSAPTALTNQTTSQTMNEAAEFAAAIQSGRLTICTMAKDTENMQYYLKGKLMRGNITSNNTVSHMINDTKYFYIWTDGQKQGTKMSLTIPSPSPVAGYEPPTTEFTSEEDYESLQNEGYTINCAAGNVSDADFVPPSDVTFQDFSAMMQAIPSPATNGQIDYKKLQEQYGAYQPPEN